MKPKSNNTKNPPTPKMPFAIGELMILAPRARGLSFITRLLGGNDANAKAAKVSIIRFTQSIWVTVSGDSTPKKAPISTMIHAATLMVIWKRIKR